MCIGDVARLNGCYDNDWAKNRHSDEKDAVELTDDPRIGTED